MGLNLSLSAHNSFFSSLSILTALLRKPLKFHCSDGLCASRREAGRGIRVRSAAVAGGLLGSRDI